MRTPAGTITVCGQCLQTRSLCRRMPTRGDLSKMWGSGSQGTRVQKRSSEPRGEQLHCRKQHRLENYRATHQGTVARSALQHSQDHNQAKAEGQTQAKAEAPCTGDNHSRGDKGNQRRTGEPLHSMAIDSDILEVRERMKRFSIIFVTESREGSVEAREVKYVLMCLVDENWE
ncbi:hypothetical protein J5N97_009466 [Dioscorea zingiberensis]|uniref:Uncharacterized protein n=1 Tax=Dioscorea zingiberensis TaxID=325984 RepID=A0A9D5HM00_9LILI|nr:hypothetical protein J5N97_009466 [Dioscorea zingiberensis]